MARDMSTLKCRRTQRIDQAAKPHGVKELRFVDVSDLTIDLLDMILVLLPKLEWLGLQDCVALDLSVMATWESVVQLDAQLGDGYNCNFSLPLNQE